MKCPRCGSENIVCNGFTRHDKQNHKCRDCGRQFVLDPKNKPISDEIKALIDKLMLERLSLRAIVRITGVSLQWLQSYVNGKYRATSRNLEVKSKKKAS
jgi:transposase-like protein